MKEDWVLSLPHTVPESKEPNPLSSDAPLGHFPRRLSPTRFPQAGVCRHSPAAAQLKGTASLRAQLAGPQFAAVHTDGLPPIHPTKYEPQPLRPLSDRLAIP